MNLQQILESLPLLLKGAGMTLRITGIAGALGLLLGTLIGVGRVSGGPVLRGFLRAYVEVLRGTPLYTQLLLVVFGVPQLTGLNFDEFTAAVLTIAVNSSAYVAEIIRGAIQSVDKGQTEAARCIGMSARQTMVYIILPQAFKRAVPPLLNELTALIKESSLVATVALVELTRTATMIATRTYKPFSAYISAGLIYLTITLTLSVIAGRIERRLAAGD